MKRTHFEFSRVAVNVLWRCANQELELGTSAPRFGINSPRRSDLLTVTYPYDEPGINLRRARHFWPCATKISPVRTVGRHQTSGCTLISPKWTSFRNFGAWSA